MSYMAPFHRRAGKLAAGLAAVFCLLAAAASLHAQNLNPVNSAADTTTLSFSWTAGGAASYVIALAPSTAPDFSVVSATGPLSAITTTYVNLAQDTSYYFRVKHATDTDSAYSPGNQLLAFTHAAAPSGAEFDSGSFTSESSAAAKVGISWLVNGNPDWTAYLLEYSTHPGLVPGRSTQRPGGAPVDLGGLEANTSYYFRVQAQNLEGVLSAPTGIISTATLALSLSYVDEAVSETSTTISWLPLDTGPQSQRAEGYKLALSDSETMTPPLSVWSTANNYSSSSTLTGLARNSEYYYEIGTLNINGAVNSEDIIRKFTTLASATNLTLLTRSSQTARLGWNALPQAPPSASAAGYILEASSTNFSGGVSLTTSTHEVLLSTLTVPGILANTTYYFRVGTLNMADYPNYSARLATITLSVPLSANLLTSDVTKSTIKVTLTAPLPAGPQENSCEGYLLQASSINFSGGSVVHSSSSYSNATNSLNLAGLRPHTVYHLRMGTLNWDGTPNFTVLPDTMTLVSDALSSAPIYAVWETSAAVSFTSLNSDGYVLEASTQPAFIPVAASSATADPGAAGLTVSGLDENTIYYFRAGALYNGATVYTLTTPSSLSTLAQRLGSPILKGVFHSSVTVSWSRLTADSQKNNAESYRLEASTSSDFNPVASSSSTFNTLLSTLTALSLSPNTSYYFRAVTLNWDGAGNYAYAASTSTLAAAPVQLEFTGQTTGQMTVNWSTASNPPDTRYVVRFSSNSGFSAPVYSSVTLNSYATFTDLEPNTTYYPEMTALNRLDIPEGPQLFSAMATLAFDPVPAAFSVLGVSSVTLNWGAGANPAGTFFLAQVSSGSGFAYPVLSSVTQALSATFSGLVPNASYYLQVAAQSHTGIPTTPVPLGTALTLPATAFILSAADTFSSVMTDGFILNWSDSGNSSLTIYDIEASTAGDFNASASSAAASVQGLTHAFGGLLLDTTYWVRIQSRGQAGAVADFVTAGSVQTLLSNVANALVTKDNTVTLQTSYGLISVLMPYGSLGGSTRITIRPISTFPPPESAVAAMRPTGIGVEVSVFPPVLILNQIIITLPYRPADLPAGVDRSRLVLALYDSAKGLWVPLPAVSDTANNKVTAQTWHLSTFQLMEMPTQVSLEDVRVYPNPFKPSSVSGVMHFDNLPPYATVKLYTFLGELVQELTADINGATYWDGNNASGRKAASGVYIALLKTEDKKSKKVVKVVIER